jgi:hypothetical protein
MKPGRKPAPAPQLQHHVVNHDAIAADAAALTTVSARSMEVSEAYGDGIPYDQHRLVSEARFFMTQAADAFLELGKRLVQIKENEPHGEFTRVVTQSLGLELHVAQRAMRAAVKYLAPRLAGKVTSLAQLGKSKLLELAMTDDDELEALAEGGTVAGLTLPDMASMSVRELRLALADSRKAADAKDKVIKAKSQKLDKLEEQIALREHAPMAEAEALQVEDLRSRTLDAEAALLRLLACVDEVMGQPATAAAETCARQSLDYLVQRIVDGCAERAISVDLAERVSPIWAAPLEQAAKASRKGGKA